MSGDFTLATEECVANNITDNFFSYPANPAAGEAFWFLVRVVDGMVNGTYDSEGPGQIGLRDDEINASPLACP